MLYTEALVALLLYALFFLAVYVALPLGAIYTVVRVVKFALR
jgi:hypothetical protein